VIPVVQNGGSDALGETFDINLRLFVCLNRVRKDGLSLYTAPHRSRNINLYN
jgi:hypothetical protein